MKLDGLLYLALGLFNRVTDGHAAGEVQHVGAVVAFAFLDHDRIAHSGTYRPDDACTSWPKSLSSVRRIRCSCCAMRATDSSSIPRSRSRTSATSYPFSSKARTTAISQLSSARKRMAPGSCAAQSALNGMNLVVCDCFRRVSERRLDVFRGERRISVDKLRFGSPFGELAKHEFYRDARAPDDRLAEHDLRIDLDSVCGCHSVLVPGTPSANSTLGARV